MRCSHFIVFDSIIFMKASYPEAKVGIDYRIPDPMMFKRWRTYLEPLGQFMALRAVDRAKIIHVLHDATSKKGVSFFSVVAKVTVDGKTQSIPLAFKVANPPRLLVSHMKCITPPPAHRLTFSLTGHQGWQRRLRITRGGRIL